MSRDPEAQKLHHSPGDCLHSASWVARFLNLGVSLSFLLLPQGNPGRPGPGQLAEPASSRWLLVTASPDPYSFPLLR